MTATAEIDGVRYGIEERYPKIDYVITRLDANGWHGQLVVGRVGRGAASGQCPAVREAWPVRSHLATQADAIRYLAEAVSV